MKRTKNDYLSIAYHTAIIPERVTLNGPLVTSLQLRTYAGYWLLYIVGNLLFFLPAPYWVQMLGAGLVFPGGGFVPALFSHDVSMTLSHFVLLFGSIIAFVASLLVWLLTGNILAPIFVWLMSALLATSMGSHGQWEGAAYVIPGAPLVMTLVWWAYRRATLKKGIVKRKERNAILLQSTGSVETPVDVSTGLPVVEELSEEDIGLMRFLLDRSLQPVGELGGFDIIDQFQTAALRYQIANMSYALSLANYCRMPALRGYLSQAQRNLIEKMKEPIVWNYWRLENAWGNLRFNGDPMAPDTDDNIMYSGWYIGMIALYQSTTGDRRYHESGSITLENAKGEKYVHDYPTLVDNACKSLGRSPFSLYPCEPNWIYPTCNNYGPMAIIVEDRLNDTFKWERLKGRYHRMLDNEFTQIDGRLDVVRSTRTGFAPPAKGPSNEIYAALFLHASSPEIARRCWEMLRADLLKTGCFSDYFTSLDHYDFGNYRKAPTAYAPLAACAVEMGDIDLARKLLIEYNEKNPGVFDQGIFYRKNASVNHHAIEGVARFGRANGIKDCVGLGMPEQWLNGPVIEEINYPDVMVAKAVSDGRNLEAVFYPGKNPGVFPVTLSQLNPQGIYQCQGASSECVQADVDGMARIAIKVDGRTPFYMTAK